MNRLCNFRTSVVVLSSLLGLTACATISNVTDSVASGVSSMFSSEDSGGLDEVDELLSSIEFVHVDSELSKERINAALVTLNHLVSPEFDGDAVSIYAQLLGAVDASEEQQEELSDRVDEMQDAAEAVFEQWADDLESFTSTEMKRRSRERHERTRERYKAILHAAEPAVAEYEAFNMVLRDHATYLAHDLNADSLAAIEEDVQTLTDQGTDLDETFDFVLEAAEAYVRAASMPGNVAPTRDEDPRDAREDR